MKFIVTTVAFVGLLGVVVGPASAAPGVTERVSVSSTGAEADFISEVSAVSADGRVAAFASLASNLVPEDTNGVADIFVRDRVTGTTERVSVKIAKIGETNPLPMRRRDHLSGMHEYDRAARPARNDIPGASSPFTPP
jgi:hypothetical protein